MDPIIIKLGDLVIVDPRLKKHENKVQLYLRLRESLEKRVYSELKEYMAPGELGLVIDIFEHEVKLLTLRGTMGWIDSASLRVVSQRLIGGVGSTEKSFV